MRRAILCALPWLAVTLAFAAPCSAQQEIFQRGNLLYQEGDFGGAAEAYETVLSAGYDGPELRYNLGNAYFQAGELGRAILEWERALEQSPGMPDAAANLELGRSLTVDAIQPLPEFWLFAVFGWWVDLLSRGWLLFVVGAGWLMSTGGLAGRILSRGPGRAAATWGSAVGAALFLVFGSSLAARELNIGEAERAVVLTDVVQVRSAPLADDDLTVFEVHEGTTVTVDQRTGDWAEIVLADGKVGWVPTEVMETI